MSELDERSISQLETASNVDGDTLLEISHPNGSTFSSFKARLEFIFDKILNGVRFTQRLNTTDKTIFGAINEVAQGGGGGGGDSVSWSQVVVSGTKIATITINNVPTDVYAPEGGGTADYVELTQAQYDALEQAGQIDPTVMYFITDGQSGNEIIDDTTTSASKVWSSDKVSDELDTKQDDLSGGSLSNVDLNDYTKSGNYWVTQTRVLNKPVTNFGYLEVLQCSSGLYMQMFTAFAADNNTSRGETYVRFYANSQWYGWNKIADSTPDTIKVTRTNLTQQGGGLNTFVFAAPAITGYTRMVVGFNPSVSSAMYVRSEDDGDNIKVLIQNNLGTSITYDVTIAVAYIRN